MVLTLLETVLFILFSIAVLLSVLGGYFQQKKITGLRSQLEAANRRIAGNQSQELTEFLSDIQQHGFTYTRVDPINMFVRSPRG